MARRPRTAAERLDELRARIDEWRRTREKRSPMPDELWSDAAELGREFGAYRVMRALSVNYGSLKRRMQPDEESRRGRQVHSAATSAGRGGFIELRGEQILGAGALAASSIELESADGTRLTVRLASGSALDVVALVAAFRRRS